MLKSYFQIFAYDDECSYLRQTRQRRSRSFVQGFLKIHYMLFQDASSISATDITGANAAFSTSSFNLRCTGSGRSGGNYTLTSTAARRATKSTEAGIVVGTGTTAVTPQDYSLATQIVDGISAGTLEHFPSSGTGLTVSNPNGSFTLERLFRNSSSGSITINEVGVYAMVGSSASVGGETRQQSTCIIRDLVSPGFTIANGEYMRIIYTVTITV